MLHSKSETKRYEFDCGKKFHIKTSVEKDGSVTFSLVGEKNGTCSAVMMETIVDLLNLCSRSRVNWHTISEICRGHQCKIAHVGFKSCVDCVARDLREKIKEEK